MQENLNRWNMKWDVDEYLKMLPSLKPRKNLTVSKVNIEIKAFSFS